MTRFNRKKAIGKFLWVVGVTGVLTVNAMAQYGGGGGGTAGGATGAIQQGNNYHVGFDRPEAWGSNTSHRQLC
jgi:hypothetical protein